MFSEKDSYIYSIRGLLINKNNVSATIVEDIEEFISIAPSLAEGLRSSMNEQRRSYLFIQNMNTVIFLLKSVRAKWLLTEAESILHSAEANNMDICGRKLEPFISGFLSLSIEMQMAQKRASDDQKEMKKSKIESYTDIVDNLTAVSSLIAIREYNKALEILLDIEEINNDPLAAEIAESLRQGGKEIDRERAECLKDKYVMNIEGLGNSGTDSLKEILAVDDRPDILRTVAGMLRGNYKVFTVVTGELALKLLETKTPDLFILDIDMPNMDGFELAQKIRRINGFAKIPILFLTSNSSRSYVHKAVEAGGNDFIVKPANRSTLLSRVGKYLIP